MAVTLNKIMREDIKHAIIKATFDQRVKELEQKRPAIAQRIYESLLPDGFAEVAKAHPDWFPSVSAFDVYIDGNRCQFALLDNYHRIDLPGARRIPRFVTGGYGTPDVQIDSKVATDIAAALTKQQEAEEALVAERKALSASLAGILASCRTVEKFLEIAPELADYVPEAFKQATQRGGLPAVQVGDTITKLMAAGLKVPKQ